MNIKSSEDAITFLQKLETYLFHEKILSYDLIENDFDLDFLNAKAENNIARDNGT